MRSSDWSSDVCSSDLNAIAGDHSQADARFSLNPASTLDNRVNIAHWEQINVPMLTIDEVMSHRQATGKTFFKIDTQGFELQVLRGMEACLSSNVDWVLKMEFAPDWLSSQDRKSTRLNSSHSCASRMPSSA